MLMIWLLVALCFHYMKAPGQWLIAVVVALFKKGDKMNPSNYRGIVLLDNVMKVFVSVAVERMMAYSKKRRNMLSKEQCAYILGRGPADIHFMINSIFYLNACWCSQRRG